MIMGNWNEVKANVLYKCKRYCCLCEQYKGIGIEVHHILPKAKGGGDTEDNAIPLCFHCHAEVERYNPQHPKGNNYSAKELKLIRDNFYKRVEGFPGRTIGIMEISDSDKNLLEQFKADYTEVLEYCIRTDPTAELVNIQLHDRIDALLVDKWSRKKYVFSSQILEGLKRDIMDKLCEFNYYISDKFMRLHEPTGMIIFRNQSYEEGRRLREEFQPNSDRIRRELNELLDRLYTIVNFS